MTKSWEEFEKLQSRIFSLIEADAQKIEWNHLQKDPDTGEIRQIDVLIIDAAGRRIDVECRLHTSPQDVTWIEALLGRKLSLGFDDMIAISASGFTENAIKKALRFGIKLYDLSVLSDNDIRSWVNKPLVTAHFLTFDRLNIVSVVSESAEASILKDPSFRRHGQDGFIAVMAYIRKIAELYPCHGQKMRLTLPVDHFLVGGQPLRYLQCQFLATQTAQKAECTLARLQGVAGEKRDISIASFDHSVPEIIEFEGNVSVIGSTEKLTVPPDSLFDRIQILVPKGRELAREEFKCTRVISTLDPEKIQLWGLKSDEELTPDEIWALAGNASTEGVPIVDVDVSAADFVTSYRVAACEI
ncbi:restriction endonuclease (plasmid) [Rhizobium sp. CB3060]|uniref:restriction endonuclease n=1 Tax=Rhizobium sp. CB3060 TaxID=3138255 RepID=UPI0021A4CE5C|nr:restriction endonuclease [Rhizobium tropici]UWU26023.1 restriction endonuclease [Rhizobium tropici]